VQDFADSSFCSYKDFKCFKVLFNNTCKQQNEDGLPAVLLHVCDTGDVEPLFAGEYCMLTVINLLDQ
jgi:hypothetical protein